MVRRSADRVRSWRIVTGPPSVDTVMSLLSAFSSCTAPESVRSDRTWPTDVAVMPPDTASARSSPLTPVTVTSPEPLRTDTLAPDGTVIVKSTSASSRLRRGNAARTSTASARSVTSICTSLRAALAAASVDSHTRLVASMRTSSPPPLVIVTLPEALTRSRVP